MRIPAGAEGLVCGDVNSPGLQAFQFRVPLKGSIRVPLRVFNGFRVSGIVFRV